MYNSSTGPKLIGIGEAVVLSVRTSADLGAHQVIVSHPDLGATSYIPYIPPAGVYRTPREGDICYVFCNENFHQYPIAWGHRISPELAKQLIGDRADNITVIYSSGADSKSVTHKIELDDGSDNGVRISTASGHKVSLSDSGAITVIHKDGPSIAISGDAILLSAGGSTLEVGASGVSLKSADGSSLDVAASIKGTAADKKSTFDEISVAMHNHTGNLGVPTTPPTKGT